MRRISTHILPASPATSTHGCSQLRGYRVETSHYGVTSHKDTGTGTTVTYDEPTHKNQKVTSTPYNLVTTHVHLAATSPSSSCMHAHRQA